MELRYSYQRKWAALPVIIISSPSGRFWRELTTSFISSIPNQELGSTHLDYHGIQRTCNCSFSNIPTSSFTNIKLCDLVSKESDLPVPTWSIKGSLLQSLYSRIFIIWPSRLLKPKKQNSRLSFHIPKPIVLRTTPRAA